MKTKCLKIDSETIDLWIYLKKMKVNPAHIFREAGKIALTEKASQLKFKSQENHFPF